ncbi:MAG: glycosyltransferase family 4 protein [Planctomycetes bacterium]|nr:glycosyltransferase family 4 protein [Planctomycetota bacterium]
MANGTNKAVRPALVISEQTVTKFPTLLGRLLVGYADKSIAVVLVVPPQIDVQPFLCGVETVIYHPPADVPFAERFDRVRLLKTLRKCKPTVLHCLCESKASLVRLWARLLDLPYVLNVNSLQPRFSGLSISATRCRKIVCLTESIAETVRAQVADASDRIAVLGIGTFPEQSCSCFAEPFCLPLLLLAGDIDEMAPLEHLFEAIHDLVRDRYEFAVVVMGEGRAESELRQVLAERKLNQIVTIVPEIHPWRSVLAAADIFLEPRALKRFSSFLLEAMSVGAAVAACRGGIDDLIIDKQTALVFDSDDSLSIRAVLQRLLDRHELARQLAQGAQKHLRRHHSVSHMIEGYLQVYREAGEPSESAAELS